MLKNLRCSVCDKYLSVLPVKVYPNHIMKCGRCSVENDGGTESLYNSVAQNSLFKCINRYERCNKLLSASQVVEHEKGCVSGTYHCPKCEYKFSGSAYQLLLHYTNQHPKSIIKNGYFSVNVKRDFSERYLYLLKDYIFFVLVENVAKDKVMYMSTVSLITCKNIKQGFSVKPLHKQARSFTTGMKPCYSLEQFECDYIEIRKNSMNEINCRVLLDLSEEVNAANQVLVIPSMKHIYQPELKNNCSTFSKTDVATETELQQEHVSVSASIQTLPMKDVLGVKLTDEFRKEYPGYELTPCGTTLFKESLRIELTCSNCKQLTGSNVFNCQLNKHIVCWDCKAWCGICNASMNGGWNVRLANINELLLLPCKWLCGHHFSGNYITHHELHCKKSSFSCPLCNTARLNLEQLCNHLVAAHKNYKNATQFNLTGYLKEYERQFRGKVSFFHNGYWFTMSWSKKQSVFEVAVVSADNTDLYEAAIICGTDKRYNRIGCGSVKFVLNDNPRFYLKRILNL